MALNLENQLRKYGSHHHHPANIVIHIVCVPVILITSFQLANLAPSYPLPKELEIQEFALSLGNVGCVVWSTFYVLLEPVAGAMVAPLIIGSTAYANHLTLKYGTPVIYGAIAINVISWIAQFIGHGVYEKRRPALLDNIIQAIFLAPFFVWLEILFRLGYRPELKARLDKAVKEDVQKMNEIDRQKRDKGSTHSAPARLNT